MNLLKAYSANGFSSLLLSRSDEGEADIQVVWISSNLYSKERDKHDIRRFMNNHLIGGCLRVARLH
jgi:hypothetical protein